MRRAVSLIVEAYRDRAASASAPKMARQCAEAIRRILPSVVVAIRQGARETARGNLDRQYLLASVEAGVDTLHTRPTDVVRADLTAARRTADELADAWLKAALVAIEKQWAKATDGQSV